MKKYAVQLHNKLIILSVALFLCAITAGCNYVWNALNRNALKEDIAELASTCGVKISNPECNMIDTSRRGYCMFNSTEKEIMALVHGLKLNKVRPGLTAYDLVKNADTDIQYDSEIWHLEQILKPFDIYKVNNKTKINAFFANNRPDQLRLKSSRAFDYLLLYYDSISSRACIFVSYSYG